MTDNTLLNPNPGSSVCSIARPTWLSSGFKQGFSLLFLVGLRICLEFCGFFRGVFLLEVDFSGMIKIARVQWHAGANI